MDNQQYRRTTDNLVLFPSAKNFPIKDKAIDSSMISDDPLQELLDEFSDYEESFGHNEGVLGELYYFEKELAALDDFAGVTQVREQIKLLEEISNRIQYLLNEIKLYHI